MSLRRKIGTAARRLRAGKFDELVDALVCNARIMAHGVVGVELDGSRFRLPGLPDEFLRSVVQGAYERPEREAIGRYLAAEIPVVELGGCLGIVTCLTNKRLTTPKKHVVVEASPELAKILQANVERNGCSVELVQAAIAYGCESVSFWVNPKHPFSSALTPIHDGAVEATVPATTLEGVMDAHKVEHCTLICDIEGQEYELVRNELPVIAARAHCVILETHPKLIGAEKTAEMLAALEGAGFRTLERREDVFVLTGPVFGGTGKA